MKDDAPPAVTPSTRPPRQRAPAVSGRLTFVDGMRGIAASMVAAYHLYVHSSLDGRPWLPGAIDWLLHYGWLGVEIFFVLSGFVIAHSIHERPVGAKFVGLFALRRSVRLDPPYWTSIVVALGLRLIAIHVLGRSEKQLPDLATLTAHLFYLQDILGYEPISSVYWTLCLEIQFYLILVVVVGISQALARATGKPAAAPSIALAIGGALAMWSLADYFDFYEAELRGACIPMWFSFFLGVLLAWHVNGAVSVAWPLSLAGLALGLNVFWDTTPQPFVAVGATLLLLWAFRSGRLKTGLSIAPLQYLGKISYTLYLLHATIGWSTISLGKAVVGSALGPLQPFVFFATGLAASIVASHVVWWAIERPSTRLSQRIALPR